MPTSSTSAAVDLGALVRPWRETLVALRLRPVEALRSPQEAPGVWLSWKFPRGDQLANLPRAVEAVQLYTLLERADRDAWLSEVHTTWGTGSSWAASSWRKHVFESRPSVRVCGWKLTFGNLEEVNLFCAYLSEEETAARSSFSPEYVQVRRALEDKIPPEDSNTIAMYLGFSLGFTQWKRVWELLPLVSSLAALQATATPSNCRLHKSGARLECVDFSPAFATPTDQHALDHLLQLGRRGVVVIKLPEFKISVTRRDANSFVTTVQEMLGSRCGGFAGKTRSVTLMLTEDMFGAIASATTDATGLDRVHTAFPRDVGNDGDNQTANLHWMAYAMFSHGANPRMRNISLNCHSITVESVAAMEELLQAEDPLAVLYRELHTSILEYRHARLETSRLFLFDPTVEAEENPVLQDKWYRGLRVLGAVGGWWVVLFPGWGKAWVHACDAQLSPATEAEEAAARPGVKAIECLELVSPRDLAATTALLRLVGKDLTLLVVHDVTTLSEDWCANISCYCPGLEELHISGITGTELAAVVERATANSAMKLERLCIDLQYIEEVNLNELIAVLGALADRHHALSKQLRAFGFQARGVVFERTIVDTEVFTHALRMLDENKTLENFRLELPITVSTREMALGIAAAFNRHQGQKLPIWANHIAVRDKAAFLSVLRSATSTHAMRELDRGVISNILDFAPKPRARNVHFVPPQIR